MLSKKSQGMPINTIIIAVIALAVLVILIFIFTGKIKVFSSNLESCPGRQGSCESPESGSFPAKCSGNNKITIPNSDCPSGQVCCIQVGT